MNLFSSEKRDIFFGPADQFSESGIEVNNSLKKGIVPK